MKIEGTVGLVGVGNMGEALIRGLLKAGVAEPGQVVGSEPRSDRRDELARQYGRYGYRRITALLRHEGWRVNAKRVQRIRYLA